jgi:hypothetical protein
LSRNDHTDASNEEEVTDEDVRHGQVAPFHQRERQRGQGCGKCSDRQCCLFRSAKFPFPGLLQTGFPICDLMVMGTGTDKMSLSPFVWITRIWLR